MRALANPRPPALTYDGRPVPEKTLVACSTSLRTTGALLLLASAASARAAEPVLSHSPSFLSDHAVSDAFVDPDWTRGVAEARAIYSGFVLRGQAVPPSVVALDYPTTSGNRVELKVGVEASWGAILDSLKGARRSIDITMIGWQVDELVPFHRAEKFGFALIDTLCEAARRGVAVNVAVNDMWFKQKGWYLTGGFDRHFDRAIKKGRCQDARGQKLRYVRGIAWHRPRDFVIGRYDHRKVWIVDGLVAYVGGYTVSDEMRENMFDAEWELRGPVVAQLQANFLLAMGYARAPLADLVECRSKLGRQGCPGVSAPRLQQVLDGYFPPPAALDTDGRYSKSLTIVQNNSLIRDPRALGVTRFYHHLIATADRHLRLAAPFFTADEIVQDVLDRYRARTCRLAVEVLFPKRPEHMLIWGYKSRNALKRLVQGTEAIRKEACGGIGEELVVRQFRGDGDCKDYGKRGRLHGKVLTSDRYASIGSANLDGVSLRRNLELNVVSTDAELIERVDQEFFGTGGSSRCADPMTFPKAGPAGPSSTSSQRP
jgi:phosphatidylserine/phosphatidylglycerophosphate/cardiolipin synthase-like enzyme